MKTKTFKKKLALNKKTIVNLSNGKLGNVKGGKQEADTRLCTFLRTECSCPATCLNTCPTVAEAAQCCAPVTEPTCIWDCTETCNTCWETNCSNPCC
jgi:hypothetical protein